MRMKLCLGLLFLLGWGATQDASFSNKSTDGEQWTKLEILRHFPLSCNLKTLASNTSSVSVNTLRPSDIKFVASIGIKETLTALSKVSAMEKLNWTEKTTQEVCLGVETDIIRHFNSSAAKQECTYTKEVTSQTGAEYLWTQAKELVRSMKENPQLDFENDWKLINVFMSNADECYLCPVGGQKSFVMSAMNKMAKTLDFLQEEVPRVFVNLVDLTGILESLILSAKTKGSSRNSEVCQCSEDMDQSKDLARWSYHENWEVVLASSKYNEKESFALVLQPFFYESDSSSLLGKPLWDSTALGVHLWNSMMEPAGQKNRPYTEREGSLVKCPPEEHSYLFTYKNSNYKPRVLKYYPVFKPKIVTFECPDRTPSKTVPHSVHQLKPADIKIVTAIGDSLLEAYNPGTRPGSIERSFSFHEGLSWSVGGDERLRSIITLPNILRKFNSKLRSYSVGHGNNYVTGARLRVAGVSSMYMSDQVTELLKKMKNDKRTNYKKDWKLLTMFIGHSDLCHSCTKELILDLESSQKKIQHALDILHKKVPRMIVNMVLPLDITGLRALHKETGNKCPQDRLIKSCPCVMKYGEGSEEYAKVVMYNKKYQKLVRDLVESGRYDTRDDFTVVLQPFFERLEMPRTEEGLPDLTYFAPDCFHFSQKMLGHTASALWNNMLEPVGQKSRQHDFTREVVLSCPTKAQPFLMTSRNSQEGPEYKATIDQCKDKAPSSEVPTSVHNLKPADIAAVASMGDATSIGRGVLGDTVKHYRGRSFSTGGDADVGSYVSLANILLQFNPELKGKSVGHIDYYQLGAGFNMGRTGIHSGNLISQAKILVAYLKNSTDISFKLDWKLITIMIGNEEICNSCHKPELYNANNFRNNIRKALDYLHENVPRALVNLMYFVDPKVHRETYLHNPNVCKYESGATCECLLIPNKGSIEMLLLENLIYKYRNVLSDMVAEGRYDTRDDFTVVLQPAALTALIPWTENGSVPFELLTRSCENHGSRVQQALAVGLWNNMFEDVKDKTSVLDLRINMRLKCPGDAPQTSGYIKTYKNSGNQYPPLTYSQDWGSDFVCNTRIISGTIPTSVHELRPSDIKVVAAMGDWITSAFASSPDNHVRSEDWQGLSWSIGGDKSLEKQVTLPNILRKFNLRVQGYSRGAGDDYAGLNVAQMDARARDLPFQARRLITKMQKNAAIDFLNDWKVITILIGINDLCDFCNSAEEPSVTLEVFKSNLSEALHILAEKLPRVFINLVEPMQVLLLYENQGGECAEKPIPCPCFRGTDTQKRSELKALNLDFQDSIRYLAPKFTRDQEDFVVTPQPFFRRSSFPLHSAESLDPSYFTEDCFYFSSRAHNELAIALWNNMLEPVDEKTTEYEFIPYRNKLQCPSALYPYFFTEKNSRIHWFLWFLTALGVVLFSIALGCIILFQTRAGDNLRLWLQPKLRSEAQVKTRPKAPPQPKPQLAPTMSQIQPKEQPKSTEQPQK